MDISGNMAIWVFSFNTPENAKKKILMLQNFECVSKLLGRNELLKGVQ